MPPVYHVLITGYGPFSHLTDNLSWRAIAPLHNTQITTPSATIHITTLGPLKVAYTTILALIPGLHARPPILPISQEDSPIPDPMVPPPPDGYDFTFHLGAGPNGALSLEQVGHKSGYYQADVNGALAPVIGTADAKVQEPEQQSVAERQHQTTAAEPEFNAPQRGFGAGYECFPEVLHTEIDVPGLITHLKQQGETRVVASTDAGNFLCDFIFFGSLAESQRPLFEGQQPSADGDAKKVKRSKSLFMHVPYDEYKPHSVGEMTEAVRQVVAWVCAGERALPAV